MVQQLKEAAAEVAGVVAVESANIIDNLVYLEVTVRLGDNNEQTADMLRQVSYTVLARTDIEFSALLIYGGSTTDYNWSSRTHSWTITPLIMPDDPVITDEAAQSVRDTDPTAYHATSGVNVRSCASTSCEQLGQLINGAGVTVTGTINGDSVNTGNSTWYRIDYGGREGYVYSAFLAAGPPPPTARPVSTISPVQPPVRGFTCPRNCAEAVRMGLTAQQAATCPGLDGDHDGVACYGD
ncbi:MAG: SH3 domain-containing protein, partial [Anaerolineae bacterium]|nr:SH3 domain-containing protein [Anaerolineae bacterium]